MKRKKYHEVRDHCHYTGECRGVAHKLCNLKYILPTKIPIAFHNGSNYDYHFIIKELAQEFKTKFTCLGENTENYITFTVPKENKLQELVETEKKLQNIYLTYCNLLIVQDLWQAHYQILSIILLKKFIELNVNTDMMIKNVKLVELNISLVTVFLNRQMLKVI